MLTADYSPAARIEDGVGLHESEWTGRLRRSPLSSHLNGRRGSHYILDARTDINPKQRLLEQLSKTFHRVQYHNSQLHNCRRLFWKTYNFQERLIVPDSSHGVRCSFILL